MFKKHFIFVMMLVVMFSLFNIGNVNNAAAAPKKLKFAYTTMNLDNPYFIPIVKGFTDRCKELGIEPIVADGKYDAATQYSQVENFISAKVDAICISPIDTDGIVSVADRAIKKGIIVISEAQSFANAQAKYIVNEYNYGATGGKSAAKWINEKLNGEAEVLIISEDNVKPCIARGDGIEQTIKKLSPKAKIVARQFGDTPELAMQITENTLQAHPNVKVIQCVNDSAALGAYQAVKAMKKNTADFYIGGADATPEALSKMKEENSVYRTTIDIDPYGTGRKCVDTMYQYVKKGPKNETFYFPMKSIWQSDLKK